MLVGERLNSYRRVAGVGYAFDAHALQFAGEDGVELRLQVALPLVGAFAMERAHALGRSLPRRRCDREQRDPRVQPERQRADERRDTLALR